MERKKKSIYKSAYRVGIAVFIFFVLIVSLVISSITKSCNPSSKSSKNDTTTIRVPDTVYLPNPHPIQVLIHDTVYKPLPCTRRHYDGVKTTKDTSK